MVADYRAGGTTYTLAKKYGCHRTTISRVLKAHDVELANAPIDSETVDEIVRLYESGLSMEVTANRLDVSVKTVFNYLRSRGIPTRAAGGCNVSSVMNKGTGDVGGPLTR